MSLRSMLSVQRTSRCSFPFCGVMFNERSISSTSRLYLPSLHYANSSNSQLHSSAVNNSTMMCQRRELTTYSRQSHKTNSTGELRKRELPNPFYLFGIALGAALLVYATGWYEYLVFWNQDANNKNTDGSDHNNNNNTINEGNQKSDKGWFTEAMKRNDSETHKTTAEKTNLGGLGANVSGTPDTQ